LDILWLTLSAPAAIIFLHVFLHRTLLRNHKPTDRLKILLNLIATVSIAWGVLAILIFSSVPLDKAMLNAGYVVLVSLAFGFCYYIIFTMSETARRIRILVDVYVAEQTEYEAMAYNKKASKDYNAKTMIDTRIDRLLGVGAIRERDGKIVVAFGATLLVSKLIRFWRRVVFGNTSDGRTSQGWDRLAKKAV
jgi:hypothetical protein